MFACFLGRYSNLNSGSKCFGFVGDIFCVFTNIREKIHMDICELLLEGSVQFCLNIGPLSQG